MEILSSVTHVGEWILTFSLVIVTWRLGDWRNWKEYYPTILFMICLSFFSSILMYDHPLWLFHGTLFLPNHTITNFLITFVQFPMLVLIYLSNYPQKIRGQIGYFALWVVIFSSIEFFFYLGGKMSYFNGWNYGYSVLFNCITFPILRLHHSKPLSAWLLSIPIAAIILLYFDFSFVNLK
ncbi:CBO0543 family protein [Peribacillus frigoritolerans]|uniref:CBO0543 family protein n=1 Tax=Peribacillus frigoritolerans TaxID=450367 RepID=UPI0038168590